jgi:hypothetical protein
MQTADVLVLPKNVNNTDALVFPKIVNNRQDEIDKLIHEELQIDSNNNPDSKAHDDDDIYEGGDDEEVPDPSPDDITMVKNGLDNLELSQLENEALQDV